MSKEPKKNNTLKILCVFCGKEYTAEMLASFETSLGCDTCGDVNVTANIEVKCSNCDKVVYRKEISN